MKLIRLIAITALKGRVVRDEAGFELTVEEEMIVPLDPENAADSRFVVEDVVN